MTAACESATGLTPLLTFEAVAGFGASPGLVAVFELFSLQALKVNTITISAMEIVFATVFTKDPPCLFAFFCDFESLRELLRNVLAPRRQSRKESPSQNNFLLSNRIVTGPSFTNSTCIIA